ncbi:ester cyclase [Mycolicibacterium cosmeticum]|uniref:ester cyclase n=1 Tax=Mycolicibacterium cosmeticum TaxID=258533 RepID=UPI003204ABD1
MPSVSCCRSGLLTSPAPPSTSRVGGCGDTGLARGSAAKRTWFVSTLRGTYLGVPVTNHRVVIAQSTIYRVESGLFADVWGLTDMAAIPAQLGV